MRCAIMQPHYLPWTGYFNLASQVDVFVFLDDVQFSRRSWQNRNRILMHGKEIILTVPVKKHDRDTKIIDIEIDTAQAWWKNHWESLTWCYSKTPHGADILDLLHSFYQAPVGNNLAVFNEKIIRSIMNAFDINVDLVRASELACGGKRSEHLLQIVKTLGCNKYISPKGSEDYLVADGFVNQRGVDLEFQSYEPSVYRQFKSTQFISHLSVVDVIANLGIKKSRDYILRA